MTKTTTKTKTKTKSTAPEPPANQCRVRVGTRNNVTGFACFRTGPDDRCAFATERLSCRESGQFLTRAPHCLSEEARLHALTALTLDGMVALKQARLEVRP